MDRETLLGTARKALELAHAPHSGFKVGAAVLTSSGSVFSGCNVEASSFGLSLCAERVAIFKAVSEGEKEIVAVAIACSQPERCVPCGACLSVISDFGPNAEIITENGDGAPSSRPVKELLPEHFVL